MQFREGFIYILNSGNNKKSQDPRWFFTSEALGRQKTSL